MVFTFSSFFPELAWHSPVSRERLFSDNHFMRTWIKFCGTTSLADAMTSIAAGADAVGFIFAPSNRHVTTVQVKAITQELPAKVEKIGVFMDETVENILSIVEAAGLTGVQLHGKESADDLARLAKKRSNEQRFRVIKTVLVKENFRHELQSVLHAVRPPDCVLLDAGAGSGQTFAWDAARDVTKEFVHSNSAQMIVAGGLTPENVGEAIKILSPWGVDIVSGVEMQAGKKDPQKLRAFVESVRRAEKK
jgi:phosphoribosylanthranilate isomerase